MMEKILVNTRFTIRVYLKSVQVTKAPGVGVGGNLAYNKK